MEGMYTDLWDAIGIINGTNADETVVIGNHRDAWILGGAADPNSGTAIIVEVRILMDRKVTLITTAGWCLIGRDTSHAHETRHFLSHSVVPL